MIVGVVGKENQILIINTNAKEKRVFIYSLVAVCDLPDLVWDGNQPTSV